jgi:nitroimidazol reductase NimA-like FMN-containing flavoprotein (pyridoxamine 5'-phosphate oxidase superfamily)
MSPGGVGRLGFYGGERGTVILPVNYRMIGQDVVFRTSAESPLPMVTEFDLVAFEVDHLDNALSEGWSVLFSGHAHQVLDETELAQVQTLGDEPWAGGDRDSYIRLALSEVSGRRIRVQH